MTELNRCTPMSTSDIGSARWRFATSITAQKYSGCSFHMNTAHNKHAGGNVQALLTKWLCLLRHQIRVFDVF